MSMLVYLPMSEVKAPYTRRAVKKAAGQVLGRVISFLAIKNDCSAKNWDAILMFGASGSCRRGGFVEVVLAVFKKDLK